MRHSSRWVFLQTKGSFFGDLFPDTVLGAYNATLISHPYGFRLNLAAEFEGLVVSSDSAIATSV